MNFEEWKEQMIAQRNGNTSEIYNYESQLGDISQYDPEYSQTYTITYNVTGNFDVSNLPTEIKSARTLKLNIPIPYGATGSVDANVTHTYENDVLTIQDVQQDIEITITVGDVLYENAKLGDYLYSDWTFGPTEKAGYLGRCIGLAADNDGKSMWCSTRSDSRIEWSIETVDTELNNFSNANDAKTDFDGKTNTQLLLSLGASKYPAAAWASEQFQGNGYLPAAGELSKFYTNARGYISWLNVAFWSSTERSTELAWTVGDFRYGAVQSGNKTSIYIPNYDGQIAAYALAFVQLSGKPSGNPKYEYVDLGLPSGTLWATMNVGANSPTEYGDYYKYGKGSKTYDNADASYSGTEVPLDMSLDTARQTWGGDWHMPTKEQELELINETTYTWVTDYNGSGVNGGLFTAQNGNFVFFPAGGSWLRGSQSDVGDMGNYLSSTPFGFNHAYYLYVADGRKNVDYYYRYCGYSIRPVIG